MSRSIRRSVVDDVAMWKQRDPGSPPATGHFSPGALRLVSGWTGDRRHELHPGHELHETFALAWRHQDDWQHEEHVAYWEVHLERWPRYRRSTVEMYASALRAARARGLGDFDAACLILYPRKDPRTLDDLQRRLRRAPGIPESEPIGAVPNQPDLPALDEPVRNRRGGEPIVPPFDDPIVTDYLLPRVWAPGHEPAPHAHAYPAIDESPCADPKVPEIRKRLDALRD
jgi:hypothetical protein